MLEVRKEGFRKRNKIKKRVGKSWLEGPPFVPRGFLMLLLALLFLLNWFAVQCESVVSLIVGRDVMVNSAAPPPQQQTAHSASTAVPSRRFFSQHFSLPFFLLFFLLLLLLLFFHNESSFRHFSHFCFGFTTFYVSTRSFVCLFGHSFVSSWPSFLLFFLPSDTFLIITRFKL